MVRGLVLPKTFGVTKKAQGKVAASNGIMGGYFQEKNELFITRSVGYLPEDKFHCKGFSISK